MQFPGQMPSSSRRGNPPALRLYCPANRTARSYTHQSGFAMNTPAPPITALDTTSLPKHFDSPTAEAYWDRRWDELGIYCYDAARPRSETFVVDTPPPTVSGSLHVGHVFSYTHTDVIVRHRRMCGKNIFYPMGWDDNGLPTERRVQNLFNVRCDPQVPTSDAAAIAPPTGKDLRQPPRVVSRPTFIELCHRVTREDEKAFMELFRRVGLSVDWRQEYATIDDHCRYLAQFSFLDLFAKGHVYCVEAPTMWDTGYQTAVAQAEVEDREQEGAFHDIRFGVDGSDESFVIATTRPELLAACVAVTAHPQDERYRQLFGRRALTPLFRVPVVIFPSALADPTKGTGILMVCTFGDQTDVQWWREQGLPLRQVLGRDGRLQEVVFGTGNWESRNTDAANAAYRQLQGLSVKQARKAIVEMLRDPSAAADSSGAAPLAAAPRPLRHSVKFYEKGDSPLELVTTRQWFVRLLDKKDELIAAGEKIGWFPAFMGARYRNWTDNLQLDWCISRQRYFGVPFPVWYPLDGAGKPCHDRPLVASQDALPVDPTTAAPPGYGADQRGAPGGFTAEADVFDTWFTSSLSPQIGSHWIRNPARHGKLFPADIRPQSHEIIRTWAFYTIAKALLHERNVPWHSAVISGWILDPDRKKMSKSKGNTVTPMHLLDEYSADGVRYWAASARLGTDTAFDESVLKIGRRLVTKLFNAGKFALSQGAGRFPITHELDRAFVHKLAALVEAVSKDFEAYEFASALADTESFFWHNYTDTFLELVKIRARGEGESGAAGQGSAVAALRLGLSVLLRLFAPVLPYITEEVWSWAFAAETGACSIHVATWPSRIDFAGIDAPTDGGSFDLAVAALYAINKQKTAAGAAVGRPLQRLVLAANAATLERFTAVRQDVLESSRAATCATRVEAELADGVFLAEELAFAN
ncbi:MAG: valine--tRNA ligase [Candidatus Schekmanbacteria bacterium]|nr:valine--tRNA ligase [Candidatus Schekmanbacteria bacterium]